MVGSGADHVAMEEVLDAEDASAGLVVDWQRLRYAEVKLLD